MGEHHTVASFDEDLGAISKLISDMGELAGSMVGGATRALLTSDNALAQRVVSDDAIMDALAPMNVHRFAMEFATPDAGGIAVLSRFPKNKMLGLGVIDHTDKNIESAEQVVARVEAALEMLPTGRISLNPDCGFSPSSINPMDLDEAYLKLRAMCQGARLLRERHG